MNDTYDFETGLWSAKNKSETYYRFDYRGQDAPVKQIQTNATIHINSNDVITSIEFENVPYEVHTPHYDSNEAEVHLRTSAAMVERERIIKLLEDDPEDLLRFGGEVGAGYESAIGLIKGER